MIKMKTPVRHSQSGNTFVHVLIGLVVVAAIGFTGWRVIADRKNTTPLVTSSTTTSGTNSPTEVSSSTPVVLPTGTDNASLNTDLSDISSSLNVETQTSNTSNSAINDQQSEIQVPTN